ncbi:hypothetical protein DIM_05790 [Candidatus Denitrolinea symbiosum]|nr:hypothetical protein DIM_05790 [Candidatus Denitrolinea symbiosum]
MADGTGVSVGASGADAEAVAVSAALTVAKACVMAAFASTVGAGVDAGEQAEMMLAKRSSVRKIRFVMGDTSYKLRNS